jgi:hypothetical protein
MAKQVQPVDQDLVADLVFRQGTLAEADLVRTEGDQPGLGEPPAKAAVDRARVDRLLLPALAVTGRFRPRGVSRYAVAWSPGRVQ